MSTLTSKLALLLPEETDLWSRASFLVANFTALDTAAGTVICTSSTRPSSPYAQQTIYETDTRLLYVRNATNTAWTLVGNVPSVSVPSDITSPYNGQVIFATTGHTFYERVSGVWTVHSILSKHTSNQTVSTQESTASTTYTDLATPGPAVTLTSVGTVALVIMRAKVFASTATVVSAHMGCTISGDTTRAAADADGLGVQCNNAGAGNWVTSTQLIPITAGTNTYTAKYRVTSTSGFFADRRMIVIAP